MSDKKETKSDLPVGEILQEAWDLFSKNISMLIIVVLIGIGLYLIPAIIGWLGGAAFISTGSMLALSGDSGASLFSLGGLIGSLGLMLVVMILISVFISTLYLSATNYAVFNIVEGKKVTAWDNFKQGLKKFWVFLGMTVVVMLIVAVGFMLLVLPGVVAAFFLSFSFYLLVVENLTIGKAISRSFEIVKKNWLLVLVMMLIIMAISMVLSWIPFINFIITPLVALFSTLVLAVIYKRVK
jgi:uncharacterized membrane protein